MADQYGRNDERYRQAYEQDQIRRSQDGRRPGPRQEARAEALDGDYGAGWYGEDAARRGESVPGPYGQPAESPSFRPSRSAGYADDYRAADRGPSDYVRADERIHEDVNERLANDGWLDASDIRVKVHKGEVTLGGLVGSRLDKRRAEAISDAVFGVKHTQNNLRVRDSSMAKPGDEQFKEPKEAKTDYDDGSGRAN